MNRPQPSSAPQLGPADFQPASKARQAFGLQPRPAPGYWRDAWQRLRRNRGAMFSLWLLIGLCVFTLIGPLLWTVDPYAQNMDRISQPPSLGATTRLVERGRQWQPPVAEHWPEGPAAARLSQPDRPELPAPETLEVVDDPHTLSVRLRWSPVEHAAGYQIYRNTYRPVSINELGLPLGDTWRGNEIGFEDQLALAPVTYWYSITATDGERESEQFISIPVSVDQATTIDNALARGWIPSRDAVQPGDQVSIPAAPLGTDYLGRDMLARLMHGARTSLFIGIVAPLLFVGLGTFYGALSGLAGGRVDDLMMRLADFVIALPFLLFMILFRVAAGIGPGESGIGPLLVALVVLSWPATARLVRGQILQLREEQYIQAARLMGASRSYLILRHMLPNTLGVVLVSLTFAIPTAIFTEAFLSFIGMGVAAPVPSWGSMSNEGLRSMLTAPHELIFPALLISLTVLAFNLLGDGLRDALDARMRARE